MKSKCLLAASMLLGLAACSNDETEKTGMEKDNTALFTGNIEGTHTRAFDQTWDATDQIGISGTSGSKAYTNICYNYASTGGGTFTAAGENIYYQDDQSVTFTAYYPWNTSLTATTTITADTWGQKDQKKFDFLYATASGSKGVPVNFTFEHKMAKLVLIVKGGKDMTYTDVKNAVCSLGNFLHEGNFDRTTRTATATGNMGVMWSFANNTSDVAYNTPAIVENEPNASVAYTLILFPQTFPATVGGDLLTFTAETGGKTYSTEIDLSKVSGNDNKNELQAGAQYNITINLNKTGLTVGTSSISKWEEKNHEINAGM